MLIRRKPVQRTTSFVQRRGTSERCGFSLLAGVTKGLTSNPPSRHLHLVLSVEISIHELQRKRITHHSEYIIHESRLHFVSFPDYALFTGQFTDHTKPFPDLLLQGRYVQILLYILSRATSLRSHRVGKFVSQSLSNNAVFPLV